MIPQIIIGWILASIIFILGYIFGVRVERRKKE